MGTSDSGKADAAKPYNVDVQTAASTTLHLKPNETLHLHGLSFAHATINVIGPDIVIADTASGHKVVLPGIGLFMFSADEAPHFVFDDQAVSNDTLLSKVGVVQNLTERDFVSFTSLDLNQSAQQPNQNQNAAPPQIITVAAPEHISDAPEIRPVDLTDTQTDARQPFISSFTANPQAPAANADYVTPAKSPHITPQNPPPTPVGTTMDTATQTQTDPNTPQVHPTVTTFEFNARLLQVAAVDNTATANHTFLGGGGDQDSTFDSSNTAQFSTETIDTVSNTGNLTIYADNPAYFSPTELTRVLQVSPVIPNGFNITSIVIGGLPTGFQILGATYDSVSQTYTVTNPTLDGRGDIDLNLQYTDLSQQNFDISIATTAKYDPNSGVSAPTQTTLNYIIAQGIEVQPVNSAADYSYTDANGNPDWVLATNPNANKIETGNGNITVYGGVGPNTITVGNGNNVIYAGHSNDSITTGSGNNLIYSGQGNDTITGGTGTNTVNYSYTGDPLTVNLSQVNGSGYASATVGSSKTDLLYNVQNITGGAGNDSFAPGPTSNVFDGAGGSNTIDYSGVGHGLTISLAAGIVNLGNGNADTLTNIQNVIGTAYNDTIQGGSQPGQLSGGAGDDTFLSSGGGYQIDGGTGSNTVNYTAAGGAITVNLAAAQNAGGYVPVAVAGATTDLIKNVENITGSSHNDSIVGDANANIIRLGNGNNTVSSGGGGDQVYVGSGSNTIDGGTTGNNELHFEGLTGSGIVANIQTGVETYATTGSTTHFTGFSIYYGTNQGDTITGSTGNDTIHAGSGNDTIYASTGTDVIDGGAGTNTISFANATNAANVDLSNTNAQNTGFGTDTLTNFQILYGSNFGGTLTASTSGSTIYGGTGGTTVINGGSGTDFLYGGSGANTIVAGGGTETITAGSGTTAITGGSGTDAIVAGGGAMDLITLGSGNTTVTNGGLNDTLSFAGLGSAATIHLDTGSAVSGGATETFSGISTFIGTNHGDTVYDSTGTDNVTGGSGNDLIYANSGTHVLSGGGGSNTITFANATGAVTVNLANTGAQNTGFGTDTLSNFQILYGSNQGGTLTASNSGSTIYGGNGGTTVINGGSGTDFLYGGSGGTTTIDGGTGTETIVGGSGANTIVGGSGTDTITAGSGTTAITTGNGTNTITAGGGAMDLITLGSGNNTVTNGGANDTLSFAGLGAAATIHLDTGSATSGGSTDTFSGVGNYIGTNHGDTVYDSSGTDNFTGGSGNDVVYTSAGTHTLNGGAGSNTISFAGMGSYAGDANAVDVNLQAGTATGAGVSDTLSNFQILYGSNNGGTLTASNSGSTIYGGTGGTTTIDGGSGTDHLYGGSGANTIVAGSGTETIVAGSGTTAIMGGSGTDAITAGGGAMDLITLGNGNTTVTNGGANDTLSFAGLSAAATIHLDTGAATSGGISDSFTGITTFIGTNHGDTVYDSTGSDKFTGGTGNDTVYANTGTHVLDGGAGTNTIDFANANTGVTVNLALTTAQNTGFGTDTLTNFQNVIGSGHTDTITGGTTGSVITDTGNNDMFFLTAGNNTVTDTGTNDTLSFAGLGSAATIHLDTGSAMSGGSTETFSGISTFIGTNHGDTVYDSTGTDNFTGGSGNDLVYANSGTHVLSGGGGTNTITFANATGAVTVNLANTGAQNTGFGTDTLSNFQILYGSNQGGTLTASNSGSTIYGGNGGTTVINGGSGADFLYGGSGGTTTIDGGSGTETIVGGSGANTIVGGSGTDTITAGSGTTAITTGNGSNSVTAGGGAMDLITLGSGNNTVTNGGANDTLSFAGLGAAATIHLDTGSATSGGSTDTFSGVGNYIGTNHGDTVYDSSGTDNFTGGSGNDVVYTSAGTHVLNGGAGSNTISFAGMGSYAGDANAVDVNLQAGTATGAGVSDTLSNFQILYGSNNGGTLTASNSGSTIYGGTGGTTTIDGGSGTDHLYGGSGANTIVGGSGAETIVAGSGTTAIMGGSGTDAITAGGGAMDLITLGNGNTTVTNGGANDTLSFAGLSAAATIHLDTGAATSGGISDSFTGITTFIGTNHGDTVYDSTGSDKFTGGTGNDTVYANTGTHVLDGGAGTNTIDFANANTGVTVNLALTTAQNTGFGTDTLTNFQNVIGSGHGDTITGNASNNVITGGAGNDTIYASLGTDTLNGGGGTNTVSFVNATNAVTVNLQAGTASGWGTDTLSNFQILDGSNNGDTLTASNSGSTIYGGTGNDVINGGSGTDVLYGGGGVNTINGGSGTETIHAGNNGDTIVGGSGTDTIYGGSGNDSIKIGDGNNTITGGGGSDTLSFVNLSNAATVHLDTGSATSSSGGTDSFSGITYFNGTNHGDTVYGSTGNDNFTGGTGNDTVYASTGTDVLNGGGGTNTLTFINATSAVTVNLTLTTAQNTGYGTDTLSNFQNIVGSGHGGDTITGSTSGSVITDTGNNDNLYVAGGNNTVTDTGTNDTLSFVDLSSAVTINLSGNAVSASGSDNFSGIGTVHGSNYGDIVYASAGSVNFTGGTGSSVVYAGTGTDTLDGGLGGYNTISFINAGSNGINVNLAADTSTGYGSHTLYDFAQIVGSASGNDTIIGNSYGTSIYLGSGNDTITGGGNNDTVHVGSGTSTINGGGGTNTIDFSGANVGVTVDLSNSSAQNTGYGTDTLTNFQNYIGSSHGDTVTGTTGNNLIYGGSGGNVIDGNGGSDVIYGGSGNDTIIGEGGGNDYIDGQGGTDRLDYTNYTNSLTLNLNSGSIAKNGGSDGTDTITNIEVVYGGQGTNVFTASTSQAYNMHGGYGSNTFIEQDDGNNDVIQGGSNSNLLNYTGVATIHANFQGASGTVQKSGGGLDQVSNVSQITAGNGNDTFQLDGNALSYFTSIDGGGGTDTVKIVDNVAATTNVASKLSTIFHDIEAINLSSMTKAGDSFGSITGDNVFSLLGTNGTLALSVKTGSALAGSITLADGSTYTNHTTSTSGSVTTTTWFDASHTHSVVLQVTAT